MLKNMMKGTYFIFPFIRILDFKYMFYSSWVHLILLHKHFQISTTLILVFCFCHFIILLPKIRFLLHKNSCLFFIDEGPCIWTCNLHIFIHVWYFYVSDKIYPYSIWYTVYSFHFSLACFENNLFFSSPLSNSLSIKFF